MIDTYRKALEEERREAHKAAQEEEKRRKTMEAHKTAQGNNGGNPVKMQKFNIQGQRNHRRKDRKGFTEA